VARHVTRSSHSHPMVGLECNVPHSNRLHRIRPCQIGRRHARADAGGWATSAGIHGQNTDSRSRPFAKPDRLRLARERIPRCRWRDTGIRAARTEEAPPLLSSPAIPRPVVHEDDVRCRDCPAVPRLTPRR
jgi:hypothetical protein